MLHQGPPLKVSISSEQQFINTWYVSIFHPVLSRLKSYGRFLPVFHKNTGKFYLRFETYSSSCTCVRNVIIIASLYQKYRFFGFLPVFHKNTGKSDFGFGTYVESYIYPEIFIEIGPFFNFGPQPGRTLIIGYDNNFSNYINNWPIISALC